jgi:hypothetical protein
VPESISCKSGFGIYTALFLMIKVIWDVIGCSEVMNAEVSDERIAFFLQS